MGTLNVRLTDEDETKLTELMAATRTEKSALVRKLINDQWVALQAGQTFVERRGGHPANLLHEAGNNSQRNTRKKVLGTAKAEARKKHAQ